ncbi:MAG: hypothetical protein HW378_208 [Anaerolineales bacterium]|nr:hypothetical protein [Anaerolineales bacterium]
MNTEPQVNGAFLRMMQRHRAGAALSDLSEAMQRITREVMHTGRAGSFTLKLTVKPASKNSSAALVIEDDIKETMPKPERVGSIFFGSDEGDLLRDNPNQVCMDLKTIDGEEEPLRKVANG